MAGLTADDKKMLRRYVKVEGERALELLDRKQRKAIEEAEKITPEDEAAAAGQLAVLKELIARQSEVIAQITALGYEPEHMAGGYYGYRTYDVPKVENVRLDLLETTKGMRRQAVITKFKAIREQAEEAIQDAHFQIVAEGSPESKAQMDALRAALKQIVGVEEA